MNKVILMGRLTRDPEIRYSKGATSTAVATFSLAVDRKFKREGEPSADFFNCTAFGKIADVIEKWTKQGTKVLVTGRIQNNNYTDRNGNKVYSVQIMVDELEFCESRNSAEQQPRPEPMPEDNDGFMNIPDGLDAELPFN